MYTCANCPALACGDSAHNNMPANCPMCNAPVMEQAFGAYDEDRSFYVTSSEIEGDGYCEWPRLREIIELSKRMQYKKIGMAFCRGLRNEARIINRILCEHDFHVESVICKTGGISKEDAGIPKHSKINPDHFEPMCNPIAQAKLLNEQQTQFNIAVGLCVGHDSLFFKYSDAPVTVLIAKDRVLAHNPVGALYCADGYFKAKLTPRRE